MNKLPVGIQVYGLRDLLENTPERFEEVMTQVKEMGYDGVELAGTYGLEPSYIKEVLGKLNLTPISAHVPLVDMMADVDKVIRDYKEIGVNYVVVPYLPEEYRHMTDGYDKVIAEMTRIGKAMTENGLTILYHNHDFEFETMGGGRVMDNLLEARKEFAFEMDTFWAGYAGVNVTDYLRELGNRVPMIHIKDYKSLETMPPEFTPIGTGKLRENREFIRTARELGKEWVIVELDNSPCDPLESAGISIENIKKME